MASELEFSLVQTAVPATSQAASIPAGEAEMLRDAALCGAGASDSLPNPPQVTAGTLSVPQQTAISLMIAGRTMASIAGTLGLSRSTISRWRDDHPLFAAELARRQRDVYDTASRRLQLLMIRAIDVIDESLRSRRFQDASAWKVLNTLKAANWATPVAPTDAERNEWPVEIDRPETKSPHATASADASQSPIADVIGTAPPTDIVSL